MVWESSRQLNVEEGGGAARGAAGFKRQAAVKSAASSRKPPGCPSFFCLPADLGHCVFEALDLVAYRAEEQAGI